MKLEDRILQYLPLLAPVPTAWMAGSATYEVMLFPIPVAVISALVIEGLGFVAVNTAIQMRDFNRRLNGVELAQKMRAPVGQAYLATGLYVVVALVMTVLLHVFPQTVIYAPIPFVLMAVAGAWLYSLRADFSAKVAEKEQGREQARQARADKKQASDKLRVQVAGASDKQGDKLHARLTSKADKLHPQASKQPVQDEALLAYWRDKPQASDRQVGDRFGTSRQAIQQRREKLVKADAIRMTKNGVEIVGIDVSQTLKAEKQA